MALYAIGDLHLCLGAPKPMDIFGGTWVGYMLILILYCLKLLNGPNIFQ